jgi:hypothetical protein
MPSYLRSLLCVSGMLLALALFAQAEIVYTSTNVLIPTNGSFSLDLNHDGIIDFTLRSSIGQLWCSTGNGVYWKLTLQPAQGAGAIGGEYAAALLSGTRIDAARVYSDGAAMLTYFGWGECGRVVLGNWMNLPNRYLGLEFQVHTANGVKTHYGWAKLTDVAYLDQHRNLQTSTLVSGFAYETTPGKAILAGQTSESKLVSDPYAH